jgi:hypothetical protein
MLSVSLPARSPEGLGWPNVTSLSVSIQAASAVLLLVALRDSRKAGSGDLWKWRHPGFSGECIAERGLSIAVHCLTAQQLLVCAAAFEEAQPRQRHLAQARRAAYNAREQTLCWDTTAGRDALRLR